VESGVVVVVMKLMMMMLVVLLLAGFELAQNLLLLLLLLLLWLACCRGSRVMKHWSRVHTRPVEIGRRRSGAGIRSPRPVVLRDECPRDHLAIAIPNSRDRSSSEQR
jgi:hypothetical protein